MKELSKEFLTQDNDFEELQMLVCTIVKGVNSVAHQFGEKYLQFILTEAPSLNLVVEQSFSRSYEEDSHIFGGVVSFNNTTFPKYDSIYKAMCELTLLQNLFIFRNVTTPGIKVYELRKIFQIFYETIQDLDAVLSETFFDFDEVNHRLENAVSSGILSSFSNLRRKRCTRNFDQLRSLFIPKDLN